ncbi:MAG: efflux RND transporter periplasmic adaptor subunit [Candidatus Eremiobacteraeota bacterium]|nr:efflux RND transporter periplasmic adaptor subunit [Candidatus Eremiobacteraeota bacterium]
MTEVPAMAFRVKDLMISVIPAKGKQQDDPGCGIGGETMFCGFYSPGGHTHPTTYMFGCGMMTLVCGFGSIRPPWGTDCHPGSIPPPTRFCDCPPRSIQPPHSCFCCNCRTSPVSFAPGDPATGAEQLAALRAQLEKAIAEIEAQEKLLAEQSQPQTVEEIEQLQAKLKEADAELEKRKAQLKKH